MSAPRLSLRILHSQSLSFLADSVQSHFHGVAVLNDAFCSLWNNLSVFAGLPEANRVPEYGTQGSVKEGMSEVLNCKR
jgi:hypothetical protein